MDFLESSYFKSCRFLLTWLGLWPFENSSVLRTKRVVFTTILLAFIFFQLTVFVTTTYSTDLLLDTAPFIMLGFLYTYKYCAFIVNAKRVKNILEKIQFLWSSPKSREEKDILEEYAQKGMQATTVFILLVLSFAGGFVLFEFMPDILDILVPLNVSRSRKLLIKEEYFIDQEKYYYFILGHVSSVAMIGPTALVATESVFVFAVQQTCAMYKITCHRIEKATFELVIINSHYRDTHNSEKIIHAIRQHQEALQFSGEISAFAHFYLYLIPLAVISLSLTLYALFQEILSMENIENTWFHFMNVSCHFSYMFYCNYLGQELINHSTDVFKKIYDTRWYAAPLMIQKTLLFFMQRSSKEFSINLGGIFTPSCKGFSAIANMSVSYCMVMTSLR